MRVNKLELQSASRLDPLLTADVIRWLLRPEPPAEPRGELDGLRDALRSREDLRAWAGTLMRPSLPQ